MRLRREPAVTPEAKATAKQLGERAVASATADDGTALLATDRALHVGDLRLPWDRVAKATWDSDERVLTVVGSPAVGEPTRTLAIAVHDATKLLEAVRSAVTSNIVVSQRIDRPGGGGAWVTARRDPDGDELRWTVVFDPGLDSRDPALRSWADDHVAAIRRSTGV